LFGKLASSLFPDSKRNDAAKPDCTLPIGDDGSLNRGITPASSLVPKSTRKVSITATCRLEWNYQLSKKIMAFSLSNIEIQWFFFQVDT
jgi:hypothetical protein